MSRVSVRSILLGSLCVLGLSVGSAFAQTEPGRFEVGGQLNLLRLEDSDTTVGLGGRLTFNVTDWLGVEGEYQFQPNDELFVGTDVDGQQAGVRYERRRSTALFGVKAGYRGERFGIFGKVRPGFTRLSDRGVDCKGDVCALMIMVVPEYRTEFALDLGGVFEFYPSSRWLLRADVGSLIVRHKEGGAPPCFAGDCTSKNFAASFGAGFRF